MTVTVEGLKELQRFLESRIQALQGPPIFAAMREATLIVQRSAKINAPVDTGRLRASITPEVVQMGGETRGIVGSNVFYAPFQEIGTKYMKGRWYLKRAFEANIAKIEQIFEAFVIWLVEGK